MENKEVCRNGNHVGFEPADLYMGGACEKCLRPVKTPSLQCQCGASARTTTHINCECEHCKEEREEYYGNWNDPDFPDSLEDFETPEGQELLQDCDGDFYYEISDEDEDEIEKKYVDLTWYIIQKNKCPSCGDKYLTVVDKTVHEFYKNNIHYCIPCGYPKGIIVEEILEDASEIEEAIEKGYTISEDNMETLKKIYPYSF